MLNYCKLNEWLKRVGISIFPPIVYFIVNKYFLNSYSYICIYIYNVIKRLMFTEIYQHYIYTYIYIYYASFSLPAPAELGNHSHMQIYVDTFTWHSVTYSRVQCCWLEANQLRFRTFFLMSSMIILTMRDMRRTNFISDKIQQILFSIIESNVRL